jgi:hypothetical protein
LITSINLPPKRLGQQIVNEAALATLVAYKYTPISELQGEKMAPPSRTAVVLISSDEETLSSRVTKRKRPVNKPASNASHTTSVGRRSRRLTTKERVDYTPVDDKLPRMTNETSHLVSVVDRSVRSNQPEVPKRTVTSLIEISFTDDEDELSEVAPNTSTNIARSGQKSKNAHHPTARKHLGAGQKENEETPRPGLLVLKYSSGTRKELPRQKRREQNFDGHAILHLEVFLGELNEDDVDEARATFDLIRRNLEKDRDNKRHIDWLTRLFAPTRQRLQCAIDDYGRLTRDMKQIQQRMKLFDDVDMAADGMDVDG